MFYTNAIEAGNKVLMNTGKIEMFGLPVEQKMTRLHLSAQVGDNTIKVDKGLVGWEPGM